MGVPLFQTVEKVVEVPVVGETIQGRQQAVSVPIAPVRQVAEAEVVAVTEMGPPLPMEQHPETVMKQASAPAPVMPMPLAMPQIVTASPYPSMVEPMVMMTAPTEGIVETTK